eukprot:TRINITY_DN4359_c0_g1_i1.p1 TRINITY_DN4359_c0_g1~~TRINITY_DN4359_c0_g1_i1.p1  ORF type:complete len:221 (+),score=37.98 TRINITY_DN4359_c0_g1_i1:318-980(+)
MQRIIIKSTSIVSSLRKPSGEKVYRVTMSGAFNHNEIGSEKAAKQERDMGEITEGNCQNEDRKLSSGIISHVLNLYGMSATAKDFEIYASNATFEDPLMCAHGVQQIKSAFYSLPKVFREAKIVEYSVQESETSPGNGEILIDSKQHYNFLGKDIDVISLIKLQIEQAKVIWHEDWWDEKPLWNRQRVTIPLVGRMIEGGRRLSMLLTHCMMGCRKDPSP